MTRIAIMLGTGPDNESAANTVLGFVEAALAADCAIETVFLNHDGIYWAHGARHTATDDFDPVSRLVALAAANDLELVACSAAAQRRGVMDQSLAAERGEAVSLREGFTLAGLGHWCEAAARADRVVQFR
ncbi:MAG: sulfurtransferase complex subunit TusD [Xanthomonadales bacterium]|nr:sulfurtransferase complex subunit TusD [Xanthomonadales bacterium]